MLNVSCEDVFHFAAAHEGYDKNAENAYDYWATSHHVVPWVEKFCLDVLTSQIPLLFPGKKVKAKKINWQMFH
jgi:hypothetical protein